LFFSIAQVPGTVVQAPPKKDEASMQATLDALASEVYDNVQTRLLTIQQQQLNEATALAGEVRKKLSPMTIKIESSCTADEKELIKCLQANKTNPLACASLVSSFEACAAKSAVTLKKA